MDQHQSPVHKVSQYGQQLIIVLGLEIFPGKVIILGFGRIGGKGIPQHILLAGKFFEVFVQPYSPVPGCRDLIVLKVKEFKCRYIIGKDIAAFLLQHGRKYDAMENNVVFTDKVYQAGFLILPPWLPVFSVFFGPFTGGRDIADGGIEPNIQHFAVGIFKRYLNTPVQVPGHCTWLQTMVDP